MSRYEQVCSLIRERRALGPRPRSQADRDLIQVIADSFMEMGPLFASDVKSCERLYNGGIGHTSDEFPKRIIMNRFEEDWPLQSEYDA